MVGCHNKLTQKGDPVFGYWPVHPGTTLHVWTDASSIGMGVVLESDGRIIEDASWLKSSIDATHINASELEAAIKGINLAIRWNLRKMVLHTDSKSVYAWIKSTITQVKNVRTRAMTEMLIRRRLEIITNLIKEYDLSLDVDHVASADNRADQITWLPKGLKG